MRWVALTLCSVVLAGCQFFPRTARVAEVHNPFPQLHKVAVVEFFNNTPDDSVVDGLSIALAYASELQAVPGFEVVPPDVVQHEMRNLRMSPPELADPGRRRLLAESLGVDALVIGSVNEYTPYYPPRLGIKVNWYAASPYFHPIPPGYGLPWGTPEEEEIPDSLVFEAEFALAREQLNTQTPVADQPGDEPREPAVAVPANHDQPASDASNAAAPNNAKTTGDAATAPAGAKTAAIATAGADLPVDWPDPRGFVPRPPSPTRPKGEPSTAPVMTHTKVYYGNNAQFTAALQNYYHTRDEARFGGWQSYLQRSDDFIRFCCHLHIAEMLTARGGAGETRVVRRWSDDR
ncbi:MAG: hypothetical protein DCC68_23610 [Planctomycetota bacterium]|nr:MAG: hypothetical protein DCC68_23610 [Planctomycetota bacterium]